ncbi:stressosome-associated protein Prli42 [Bacillus marasmi]|nr:stressosome-associated protein Prli42 [Bacillus marasmi]
MRKRKTRKVIVMLMLVSMLVSTLLFGISTFM